MEWFGMHPELTYDFLHLFFDIYGYPDKAVYYDWMLSQVPAGSVMHLWYSGTRKFGWRFYFMREHHTWNFTQRYDRKTGIPMTSEVSAWLLEVTPQYPWLAPDYGAKQREAEQARMKEERARQRAERRAANRAARVPDDGEVAALPS